MRRIVVGGIALFLVLGIAVVVTLLTSLDAIVARAIETEGTRILGVPVRVGSVALELADGAGTIRGLRVANPEGFENREAFALDEIELALDARSIQDPPLRLTHVRIGKTTVHLEVDERGRTNLDALTRRAEQPPASETAEAEPTRVAIERLDFAGGTVTLDRPGTDRSEQVELPAFSKTGIGGASGATGGEIARELTRALARQVATTAAGREAERAVGRSLGGRAGEAAGAVVRGLLRD